jgi:hypothetical protein
MIMDQWELWIYRWWTHIPEWRYACQYFWVRLAINAGGKSFSKKFKAQMDTSLNKAQHKQELLCGKYLALVGMCMFLRNLSTSIEHEREGSGARQRRRPAALLPGQEEGDMWNWAY